jgi:hypothetical protein
MNWKTDEVAELTPLDGSEAVTRQKYVPAGVFGGTCIVSVV